MRMLLPALLLGSGRCRSGLVPRLDNSAIFQDDVAFLSGSRAQNLHEDKNDESNVQQK